MKTLVTYYSVTGNTEQLANVIHKVIESDKEILPIEEVGDLGRYDLIFCGFPIHGHSVPLQVQEFIKGIPEGKRLAVFSTHGASSLGTLAMEAIAHAVSMAKNVKVLGTFCCRGEVDLETRERLGAEPEHKAWTEEAQSAHGHPDENDLEDCADFARRVMAKAHLE
jgi:flavodoxin